MLDCSSYLGSGKNRRTHLEYSCLLTRDGGDPETFAAENVDRSYTRTWGKKGWAAPHRRLHMKFLFSNFFVDFRLSRDELHCIAMQCSLRGHNHQHLISDMGIWLNFSLLDDILLSTSKGISYDHELGAPHWAQEKSTNLTSIAPPD